MRLLKKIKIHTHNSENFRAILFRNKPIFYYSKNHFFKSFTFAHKFPVHHNTKPVFYLQVNRIADYTLPCIQHWINIIREMKADFYFICDNNKLEYEILSQICFPDMNIKFINSWRKKLKDRVSVLSTKYWLKATAAHLTSFYHAKQNQVKKFWKIDADDTMICMHPTEVARLLRQVESYAEENDVVACSLDMWRSRTKGKHWSFGVSYIRDTVDFCSIFDKISDLSWTFGFEYLDIAFNLDWFFNYLKERKSYSIETFFPNNCYFVHWGNFIRNPIGAYVCYWVDDNIFFPLMEVFHKKELAKLKIADCVKINTKTSLISSRDFLWNEVTNIHWFSPQHRHLHSLEDFFRESKLRY